MPPDDQSAVANPPGPSESASLAAPAESAAPSRSSDDSLGTLRDAFRADPDGAVLKSEAPERADPDRPDGAAPPGDPAAKRFAAQDPGDRKLQPGSRRGQAAAETDRAAELDRLVAERAAEKARADQAASDLARVNEQHQRAQSTVLARIGDDREFARLSEARVHNTTLTYDEDARLDAMLAARGEGAVYWDLAERGHRAYVATKLADRCDRYGLDREHAFGADVPDLVDHAVAVTEQRVRSEQAERISQLEAELKGLRPRAAAASRQPPTTGGVSAPGGGNPPLDDNASPMDFFRAGARQHEQQLAAASRSNRR